MKKQIFYKLSTLGLVITLLFMSTFASAQTKYAFKGVVKDAATGEGLVGATVNIGGTFQGCVADASGNYE